MGKRVILTLMEGSFEQGFPAILRISENNASAETGIQIPGKLPPAPDVLESFKNWQSTYRHLVRLHSRIKAKPAQITQVSYRQLSEDLSIRINDWLNSGSGEWQKIRDGLQRCLNDSDEIQLIIQTHDTRLRQLPWQLWNLFEHYPKAEVALSASEYQPPEKSPTKKTDNKVRILAIFGNSEGIDTEKDRAFLAQLSNQAKIKFLVEPQLEELNDHLWEHSWDILFFAGHSSSQDQGILHLNQTDAITLDQLRYALKKAIARGLKLAIFNSCDGLGLAKDLADLHIPQVIVMREPVPDMVAQEFLKHFLTAFSSGQSLYASVREARERLQKLESKFPCASWLPVICTNPAEAAMTWPKLGELGGNSLPVSWKLVSRYTVTILLGCIGSYLFAGHQIAFVINELGLKNHKQGQLFKAQRYYYIATLLDPNFAEPHYNLASLCDEGLSDMKCARQEYQRAGLRGLPEAYAELARLEIGNNKDNNYDAALKAIQEGLKQTRYDAVKAALLKNRGWIRWEQKRLDEAENDLRSAIALAPKNSPHSYCLLAQVLEAKGRRQEALVAWKKVKKESQSNVPEQDECIPLANQRLQAQGEQQ